MYSEIYLFCLTSNVYDSIVILLFIYLKIYSLYIKYHFYNKNLKVIVNILLSNDYSNSSLILFGFLGGLHFGVIELFLGSPSLMLRIQSHWSQSHKECWGQTLVRPQERQALHLLLLSSCLSLLKQYLKVKVLVAIKLVKNCFVFYCITYYSTQIDNL